jgi:hypothetical protein
MLAEFGIHRRAISSFFLGWPFSLAIYYILIHINPLISKSFRSNHHSPSGDVVDVEEKSGSGSPATLIANDAGMLVRTFRVLLLVMNLSVAAATLGTFVSLLAFKPSNAATSCGTCVCSTSSQILTIAVLGSRTFGRLFELVVLTKIMIMIVCHRFERAFRASYSIHRICAAFLRT